MWWDSDKTTNWTLNSTGAESLGTQSQGQGQSKYVHRQIRTWTKQYRASETEKITEMEELIARLPALLPAGTVQYSTVQYSTVQYSTVQYSTVQYSIV